MYIYIDSTFKKYKMKIYQKG